ncbi:hypothetical protein T492DRAFT_1070965 [Pavlovales sp. CCMP2436]|nr:hypothetical protein T492DRAFT_1070965 [Pavlovales sp. CCMP2436]
MREVGGAGWRCCNKSGVPCSRLAAGCTRAARQLRVRRGARAHLEYHVVLRVVAREAPLRVLVPVAPDRLLEVLLPLARHGALVEQVRDVGRAERALERAHLLCGEVYLAEVERPQVPHLHPPEQRREQRALQRHGALQEGHLHGRLRAHRPLEHEAQLVAVELLDQVVEVEYARLARAEEGLNAAEHARRDDVARRLWRRARQRRLGLVVHGRRVPHFARAAQMARWRREALVGGRFTGVVDALRARLRRAASCCTHRR